MHEYYFKNKNLTFMIFWLATWLLICIPLNIFIKPIIAEKLNIPDYREIKLEKTCVGATRIICFNDENSKTEAISNSPIIYTVMFILEILLSFCSGYCILILHNPHIIYKTIDT